MTLICRPPSWRYYTSNITGTPPSTLPGLAITAGASNAEGTAVTILSALAHDVELLSISCSYFGGVAQNISTLLDVLVDPAGGTSWVSYIDDLLVGQIWGSATPTGFPVNYHFPIWIPAGSSIGARARTALGSPAGGGVVMIARGGNSNPGSWWCGQKVTSIAVTPAASTGTAHTSGNSGTFSSWTDLGSTLPQNAGAFQFGIQGTGADTTQNAAGYHFEFGIASTRIGPTMFRGTTTSEQGFTFDTGPIFYSAPAGSQLQVRGTCSGTAEIIDVAAYAVH